MSLLGVPQLTCHERQAGQRGFVPSSVAAIWFVSSLLFVATLPVQAAGPVFWDYPEGSSFTKLELHGMALDQYGRLTAGLAAEKLLSDGPEVCWQAIPDGKGGLYVATGHNGQIWFLDRKDHGRPLATLPEPEIFSLLQVDQYLFAGGGPDGHLYRVDKKTGEAEVWVDLHESYIWALAGGEAGKLYVAAGSPAAVYLVTDRLDTTRLSILPAANALDLVIEADGQLLVATQGPGLIYRIDPKRPDEPELLYETDQEEVRQFARGPDETWYALALSRGQNQQDQESAQSSGNLEMVVTPNGMAIESHGAPKVQSAVYRLGKDGIVTRHWAGQETMLAIAFSQTWGWLGAGLQKENQDAAALVALESPGSARPLATWDAGDVLDLLVVPGSKATESVFACLAQPGQVMRMEDRPAEPAVAMSEPIDGGQPIRWGRLYWEGAVPKEGRIRWSVRGGARSVPDQTWSEWSESWSDLDHAIPLPPSRFLQWRVEIVGGKASVTVDAVTVSGYEPNNPPEIFQFGLEPEGDFTLGGLLARDENVTESFKSGLKIEYNIPSRQSRRADMNRAALARPLKTFSWLVVDPNNDRLEYQLEYQRLGEQTWRPVGPPTQEQVVTWDTASVPDGQYVLRLTASDRPDNPQPEVLTTTRLSAPIYVDHTPPEIKSYKIKRSESGFVVSFRATDTMSPLAEAWLELPGGSRERLDPVDGICDSMQESFDQGVDFPREDQTAQPEPWRIRVEVADRQGNIASEEGEVH